MLGLFDTANDTVSDDFDRLALLADSGLSRRNLLARAAGLAVASVIPPWVPLVSGKGHRSRSHAHSAATVTRPCLPQQKGQCPPESSRTKWNSQCAHPVAKETTALHNGCGPLGGLAVGGHNFGDIIPDDVGAAIFTDACNSHDCCYGTCNSVRAECDAQALRGWLNACNAHASGADTNTRLGPVLGLASLAYCYEVAAFYYDAIRLGGTGAFETAQSEVCECCVGPSECAPGQTICAGSCVDVQTDNFNCGGCGKSCGSGEVCSSGACGDNPCPAGETLCAGACVDTYSDPNNCGKCGNKCGPNEGCDFGEYCYPHCPLGTVFCKGSCLEDEDLWSDPANCGECGNICGSNHVCERGECVSTVPTPCGPDLTCPPLYICWTCAARNLTTEDGLCAEVGIEPCD